MRFYTNSAKRNNFIYFTALFAISLMTSHIYSDEYENFYNVTLNFNNNAGNIFRYYDTISLCVDVSNSGSYGGICEVYLKDSYTNFYQKLIVFVLQPNEREGGAVNIEAKHLGLGKHSLTAIADAENKVLELREDDNTSKPLDFEIIPEKDTIKIMPSKTLQKSSSPSYLRKNKN